MTSTWRRTSITSTSRNSSGIVLAPSRRPQRIVALGASNLTRGFRTLVCTARELWGSDVEILGALGHGRSYGAASTVLIRTLPGILESGLWAALDRLPPAPTRALVTDVGNDIVYGRSAEQILTWIEACVDRLQRTTEDIVLTDLPLASIRRLSPSRFLFFRSILFPRCRMSLAEVIETAERVVEGLNRMSARHGLRLSRMREEWYGFDPIHLNPRVWRDAWQEILCGHPVAIEANGASPLEALRLYVVRPERQWLLGIEQRVAQTGLRLPRGATISLF